MRPLKEWCLTWLYPFGIDGPSWLYTLNKRLGECAVSATFMIIINLTNHFNSVLVQKCGPKKRWRVVPWKILFYSLPLHTIYAKVYYQNSLLQFFHASVSTYIRVCRILSEQNALPAETTWTLKVWNLALFVWNFFSRKLPFRVENFLLVVLVIAIRSNHLSLIYSWHVLARCIANWRICLQNSPICEEGFSWFGISSMLRNEV